MIISHKFTLGEGLQNQPTAPKPTEPKPTAPKPTEPPHTHKYVSKTVAPTCTQKGYTVHTCSCGASYTDSYVDPIPHTPKTIVYNPTCTTAGSRDTVCAICGKVMHSEQIAPTGHDFQTKRVEPTCEIDGYEEVTCSKCGFYEKTIIPRTNHDYEWVVTTPATNTSEGTQSRVCKTCGKVQSSTSLPRFSQNTKEYEIDIGGGRTQTVRGFYNPDYENQVVEMLNAYRAENGVHELPVNPYLVEAAAIRGREQAVLYSHQRPNGLYFSSVMGPHTGSRVGENLALENPTPENVMQAWKDSEGHNNNMLRSTFNNINVSCFFEENVDTDGERYYSIHWVQLFG